MKNILSWLKVEQAILNEIKWLKNNIFPFQPNKNPLNYSDDIFYRLIAILIVSGKIKVFEYGYSKIDKINFNTSKFKTHGSAWHDGMINYLSALFVLKGYKVIKNEPQLYYGHADLKVVNNESIIFFEIDTINVFKFYINLLMMNHIKIAVITYNKIIKFEL